MKTIIALAIIGMMLLLPAAALAQVGPGYQQFARQGLWNQIDTFRLLGNGTQALFSGARGESNAAFLGQWQANSSMGANASTVVTANLLGGIFTDSVAQDDLNYGFLALGQNASQIQCGNLRGPGASVGAVTGSNLNENDCAKNSSKRGQSAVAANKSSSIGIDYQGTRGEGARALASLIRGGLSAFALTQKGVVGAVNPFSG